MPHHQIEPQSNGAAFWVMLPIAAFSMVGMVLIFERLFAAVLSVAKFWNYESSPIDLNRDLVWFAFGWTSCIFLAGVALLRSSTLPRVVTVTKLAVTLNVISALTLAAMLGLGVAITVTRS